MAQTSKLSGIALSLLLFPLATEASAQDTSCEDEQILDIAFARILESDSSSLKPVHLALRVTSDYGDYDALVGELRKLSSSTRPIIQIDSAGKAGTTQELKSELERSDVSVLVVVDSEFMIGDIPKYNSVLKRFNDTQLSEDLNMLVDPYIDTLDKGPIFLQVAPGLNATNLAYRIEAAGAALRIPRLLLSQRFIHYQGSLARQNEPSNERDPIIVLCLMESFQRSN